MRTNAFCGRGAALLLGLCSCSTLAAPYELTNTLVGRVISVVDGDTIVVVDRAKTKYTVELFGIDAPETRQPHGAQARKYLSSLVRNQEVRVQWVQTTDQRAIIGKVWRAHVDVNYQLVLNGLAWHDKQAENDQTRDDRKTYADAEQSARAHREGLWKDENTVPPWVWRKVRVRR